MNRNGWFSKYVLVWAYGRGSLQYDIICALILAFIFLINPSCFNRRHYDSMQTLDGLHDSTEADKAAAGLREKRP